MTVDVLLEEWRPFAIWIAREYRIPGADREDVEQEAMVALWQAVRDYRAGHGTTFKTFAALVIRRHLITCLVSAQRLEQPLHWRRPRRVFVNSLSDLFHEEIPRDFVIECFNTMGKASQHTFQVLTKRPEIARDVVDDVYETLGVPMPLPNVWLGVSIENARFTWRADVLREIPAAVRFISAEPLLGSLIRHTDPPERPNRAEKSSKPLDLTGIDWVIVGGESGPGARPMHPDWAREIRDACLAREIGAWDSPLERPAFFFKQAGSVLAREWGCSDAKGHTLDEIPADLRIREFPEVRVAA